MSSKQDVFEQFDNKYNEAEKLLKKYNDTIQAAFQEIEKESNKLKERQKQVDDHYNQLFSEIKQ